MSSERLVEIECRVVSETEMALKLSSDGQFWSGEWVPKSVVEFHANKPGDKNGIAVMPEGWAVSKGFV